MFYLRKRASGDFPAAKIKQVMVLNCGDQTMDVTSYLMESCDPLQLSQLAEPCGGAGGGSIVDARFKAFFQVSSAILRIIWPLHH